MGADIDGANQMKKHPLPMQLGFVLAWQFDEVLNGDWCDRKEGTKYPIIGPIPCRGRHTQPKEGHSLEGPYIYALYDGGGAICYIGSAITAGLTSPISDWVKGNHNRTRYYWSHGINRTSSTSTIVKIAEGINNARGTYCLYFLNHASLMPKLKAYAAIRGYNPAELDGWPPGKLIQAMAHALTFALQPTWNTSRKNKPAKAQIQQYSNYWLATHC